MKICPQPRARIAITGAAGFIGQHLIEHLAARFPPASIRAFDIRSPQHGWRSGIQTMQGSVEKDTDVTAALADVEIVVHLAGLVQPESRSFEQLWRVHVEGTETVYAAATEAGCSLFIHLSSAGVYGQPRRSEPFREEDVALPVSPYQRTKWEAEQVLRRRDNRDTVLTVLRPTGIYGPGSLLEIPRYRNIRDKRWAFELPGGVLLHPTHVRDVVGAIGALIDAPAPHGSTYNLGGERPVRLSDLDALVARTLGVARHRLVIPAKLAGPTLRHVEPLLASIGRPNPLRQGIGGGALFSSAVDDHLFRDRYPQVPIVPLEAGVREHVDWAVSQRLL